MFCYDNSRSFASPLRQANTQNDIGHRGLFFFSFFIFFPFNVSCYSFFSFFFFTGHCCLVIFAVMDGGMAVGHAVVCTWPALLAAGVHASTLTDTRLKSHTRTHAARQR